MSNCSYCGQPLNTGCRCTNPACRASPAGSVESFGLRPAGERVTLQRVRALVVDPECPDCSGTGLLSTNRVARVVCTCVHTKDVPT